MRYCSALIHQESNIFIIFWYSNLISCTRLIEMILECFWTIAVLGEFSDTQNWGSWTVILRVWYSQMDVLSYELTVYYYHENTSTIDAGNRSWWLPSSLPIGIAPPTSDLCCWQSALFHQQTADCLCNRPDGCAMHLDSSGLLIVFAIGLTAVRCTLDNSGIQLCDAPTIG